MIKFVLFNTKISIAIDYLEFVFMQEYQIEIRNEKNI